MGSSSYCLAAAHLPVPSLGGTVTAASMARWLCPSCQGHSCPSPRQGPVRSYPWCSSPQSHPCSPFFLQTHSSSLPEFNFIPPPHSMSHARCQGLSSWVSPAQHGRWGSKKDMRKGLPYLHRWPAQIKSSLPSLPQLSGLWQRWTSSFQDQQSPDSPREEQFLTTQTTAASCFFEELCWVFYPSPGKDLSTLSPGGSRDRLRPTGSSPTLAPSTQT